MTLTHDQKKKGWLGGAAATVLFLGGLEILVPGILPRPVLASELAPIKQQIDQLEVSQAALANKVDAGFIGQKIERLRARKYSVLRHKASYPDSPEIQLMDDLELEEIEAELTDAKCELVMLNGGICGTI